jgi:HD domain
VGCHSDAHEQAKWFGDDIAMKSGKYDHEVGSLRGAAAALRLIASGNPPLHRFRVGLEFALSGHRDLDGMIAQHARLAAGLAAQLGLPAAVQAAVSSSYEQWDGRGWPGRLRADQVPIASRVAQLAEFTEVALRIGGVGAACELAAGGPAGSSIRRWPGSCAPGPSRYSAAFRRCRPGTRSSMPSPRSPSC